MDDFRNRLSEAGRRFGIRHLAGALLKDGEIHHADCASGAEAFGVDTPQPIACLAKVFTASLVARAIAAGDLDLNQRVDAFFNTGPLREADGAARNVTVFHLLSHTHGWAAAPDPAARWGSDGFIAPHAILSDLTHKPRLYEPGEIYSYDTSGYFLLGAMLEKLYRENFGAVLRRRLLEPLGIESGDSVEPVCPADGYGISLSARALSRFAEYNLAPERFEHALPNAAQAVRMLFPRAIDAPGWSPFYQGTTLAWRDLGGRWLSHEGVGFGGTYCAVRINPTFGMGLVLVSPDPRSRFMGAQLFGDVSKSDLTADFALPLSGVALSAFDAAPLCGTYVNGQSRTTIRRGDDGQLQALVHGHRSDGEWKESALQPATRNVLFLKSPIGRRHFLQPLASPDGASSTHIWDGYEVARRI